MIVILFICEIMCKLRVYLLQLYQTFTDFDIRFYTYEILRVSYFVLFLLCVSWVMSCELLVVCGVQNECH